MYGLPITLSPQQQVACGAKKWKGLTQTEQMGVIITLLAKLANMPITCQDLQSYAGQFSCLPPQLQIPAMIYLLSLIAATGSGVGPVGPPGPQGPTGPLQIFDTVGTPVFNPGVSDALAFDNVTVPGQPAAWVWSQGVWTQFLG